MSQFWAGDEMLDSFLLLGLVLVFIVAPLRLLGAILEGRRYERWKRDRRQGKGHHVYVHPNGRTEARWTREELRQMIEPLRAGKNNCPSRCSEVLLM